MNWPPEPGDRYMRKTASGSIHWHEITHVEPDPDFVCSYRSRCLTRRNCRACGC